MPLTPTKKELYRKNPRRKKPIQPTAGKLHKSGRARMKRSKHPIR